jgi:tetratricopeptide (TPR) repeat protein
MTVTQKVLITAMLATAVGTAIYEARQASRLRREVQVFQQQQRTLAEQNDQLSRDRDDATNRLALLADHIATPPFGRQVLPVNAATVAGRPSRQPITQDDAKNEHAKAVTGYTKTIEAEPKAFSPRFNRGVHYHLLQQHDNAIADFTKIIDDPEMDFSLSGGRTNGISRAHEYRGRAYQNKKDYAKAIADYDEALRFDPSREEEDETNIQWRRGLCYRALQQEDKAMEVANLLSGRALQWALAPGDTDSAQTEAARTSARFANEILGQRGHRRPFQLEVCAAVSAKSGDFLSAVLSQMEALRALSPAAEAQRPAMQARLEQYQANKPLYKVIEPGASGLE